MPSPPPPSFDAVAIAAVIDQAARELALRARAQHVTVLVAWPTPRTSIEISHSGWCELDRIGEPAGRFWWLILWHPERAEGRLLLYVQKPKRGSLGEIVDRA